jgi:hypothetical protein
MYCSGLAHNEEVKEVLCFISRTKQAYYLTDISEITSGGFVINVDGRDACLSVWAQYTYKLCLT